MIVKPGFSGFFEAGGPGDATPLQATGEIANSQGRCYTLVSGTEIMG